MVPLVQLVRASDCGSECHGFESHRAPQEEVERLPLFLCLARSVLSCLVISQNALCKPKKKKKA